ncbi:MAG: hypothetical protein RJA19_1728 [Bacteroidota bacterium]
MARARDGQDGVAVVQPVGRNTMGLGAHQQDTCLPAMGGQRLTPCIQHHPWKLGIALQAFRQRSLMHRESKSQPIAA